MIVLMIAFIISVILALIIIPILRKIKVGQIEREDGPQSHLKKQGTPTMGGIIFMLAIIICVTGTYIYLRIKNETALAHNLLPMLCLTIGFGVIGFIDDFKKLVLKNTKGLSPSAKMIGLLLISVAYTLFILKFCHIGTDVFIPFFKTYISLPVFLYIPFAIIVILAATNAVNLTDGVDGLAGSVSTIMMLALSIIAYKLGYREIALYGIIVTGAIMGFLIYNFYKAKIIMGDVGSLFLGGVISSIAIYMKYPFILVIIAIIPVIETLSVIAQVLYFRKTGKRLFRMSPLHHHFELSGWRENKVVAVFSLVTLIASIIGILAV